MQIGIIGSGHIGGTMARLLVAAGHRIAISNSRGPESLREFVRELGPSAHAMTAEDASRFGEAVLLAIPLKDYPSLSAEAMSGKIAIDAMNYYPDRDGHIAALDSGATTSSMMVADHLKDARVVKAFNTIWFEHLKVQGKKETPLEERRVVLISGEDSEALEIVTNLIHDLGFGALRLGTLAESAQQQPGAPLYNRDVTVAEARRIAGVR